MADREKGPEKIDIERILGGDGDDDTGEIELLDPTTGEPIESHTESDGPHPRSGGEEGLAAALAEKEKYYDLWVRGRAEFDNFRKRMEREREDERSQAEAALVRELLSALDNLDRALESATAGDPFVEGILLIQKQISETLSAAGLEPIDALGEPFDPLYHDAVAAQPTDEFEPNRIIEEIQKGYLFRGRVLRPSLVRVAAPSQAASHGDDL